MQDRTPQYPGRVTLTPVEGQANTYDMIRADQPTQAGTPLNKANLLKDTTAALFGLGTGAVPDDVLGILSRLHAGLGNEHLWKAASGAYVPTPGSAVTKVVDFATPNPYHYSTEIQISSEGVVTLNNPRVVPVDRADDLSWLAGKYLTFPNESTAVCYVVSLHMNSNFAGTITYNSVGAVWQDELVEYYNSSDPNAYPPAEDDGNTYTYLGQLGSAARIETGTYVGTGKYGASNKNTLTFNSVPKLILIQSTGSNDSCGWILPGLGYGSSFYAVNDCTISKLIAEVNDKTISWYLFKDISLGYWYQLNEEAVAYHYAAIG